MKLKYLCAFVAMSGLSISCGSSSFDHSDLDITNGLIIAEDEYPAVVNLYRRVYKNGKLQGGSVCTGTWVAANTILTAAHCTGDGSSDANGKVSDLEMMVFEISNHDTMPKETRLISYVTEAYRLKQWEQKKGYNRYDLAILKTEEPKPGEKARSYLPISKTAAKAGDAIEIIGYGYYDMSMFGKKGDDKKRVGRNTVANVSGGFLNIKGELKNSSGGPTGENSSAGQGDSGGPMLLNGALVGIASGGGSSGIFPRGEASYVDLHSEESRLFLEKWGLRFE
ncbi:MAG: trypsin-like serine protease [Oligoflexus sp.]